VASRYRVTVSGQQHWPAWATEPVDADPAWTVQGEQERDHLETLLAPWLIAHIEHVGSTAIPDLPAKPIIDLQAPVSDLRDPGPIAPPAPATKVTPRRAGAKPRLGVARAYPARKLLRCQAATGLTASAGSPSVFEVLRRSDRAAD